MKNSGRDDTPLPQVSLADMISPEGEGLSVRKITGATWIKILVLTLLVGLFYHVEIRKLINQWLADANWSHGFIIPLFSLFLLYSWRRELLSVSRRVCLWGLLFVLLAFLIKAGGLVVLKNNWITQLSIPILIFGVVLYLGGPRVGWMTMVPIFFLALAMPLPDRLYQMFSLPMQDFAAKASTALLRVFGAQIEVRASFMQVTSISGKVHPLLVAEACSGMRSLMAFIALGVAMAYVERRPFWQRLAIMFAGVPIALVVNILRVAATSTMFIIDKKELGEDFMHTAMGMLLLIPALLLLFLFSRVLNGIYEEVDEEDEEDEEDSNDSPAQSSEVES